MNILVTGATGQLAQSIKKIKGKGLYNCVFSFVSREDFLVTNQKEVDDYFSKHDIDVVINCTAYTKVDLAEDENEQAYDVNVNAVRYLAEASERKGAEFYHVSTDFVFDGNSCANYKESDITNPLSVYGKTKLEGENIALSSCLKTQVIRTSWLYSLYGNNFVKTIIRLAKDRDKLTIVSDQVGTPTNAENLARAILKMIFSENKHYGEVYHYSDLGECSWYEFAKEIVSFTKIDCEIIPIPSSEYPQKATRPKYSVMDKSKIVSDYGVELIDWKMSLKQLVENL